MNIIAHNMSAMYTQRQLNINTRNKAKASEKLSSGYRINRASDDAAGLQISEKMRSQIRGLNRASKNAQDGISLCQVADGALAETQELLQRMNELTIQAANDTNQEIDRDAIQQEINALKEEINRIANHTEFNRGIHPLKGKGELTEEDISSSSGTHSVVSLSDSDYPGKNIEIVDAASISQYRSYVDGNGKTHYELGSGTFQIDGLTNCVFDVSGETCIENTSLKNISIECDAGTTLSVKNVTVDNLANHSLDPGDANTEIGSAIRFTGGGNTLNCYGKCHFIGGADNYKAYIASNAIDCGDELTVNGTASSELNVGGNAALYSGRTERGYGIGGRGAVVINSGNIVSNSNLDGLFESLGSAGAIGGKDITINGGTINIRDRGLGCIGGSDTDSIIINGGTISANCIHRPRGCAIGASGTGVVQINGGSVYAKNYSGSTIGGRDSSGNYDTVMITGGTITAIASRGGIAIGSGLSYVDGALADTKGTDNGKGVHTYTYPAPPDASAEGQGEDEEKTILWLQTGANYMQGMFIHTVDATTAGIGLEEIDVSSYETCSKAIPNIQSAIDTVSGYRSLFGAWQNRLEYTVSTDDITAENTQYAESRLRDADMAQTMVEYSKDSILEQAAQAMMAQTKQSTQGIINLINT